jgi:hypothetical protein
LGPENPEYFSKGIRKWPIVSRSPPLMVNLIHRMFLARENKLLGMLVGMEAVFNWRIAVKDSKDREAVFPTPIADMCEISPYLV